MSRIMSSQIGPHQLGCLRLSEVWIGNRACRPALAGEGQVGHRRERHSADQRFTAGSTHGGNMHKQTDRKGTAGGVTRNGDLRRALLGQTAIASLAIPNGTSK